MDIPFFRKKPPAPPEKQRSKSGATDKTAHQPTFQKNTAVSPVAVEEADFHDAKETGLTGGERPPESAEASAETCSVIEEAAIFYANDRNTQAIAVLTQYLQEHPDQPDLQPWLMLFDLYQSQGMKQEFDKYALDYVVRFERSSPAWVDTNTSQEVKTPAPKTSGGDYVSLSGQVTVANLEAKLKRVRDFAQNSPVRLDFAKLEGIDQPACQQLTDELQKLKQAGKKIRCINTSPLIKILKAEVEKTPDEAHQSYWLLLFYLYQASGLQAEFEDLAVEYAVAYEVSPPSWEEITEPITLQESPELPTEAVDADDIFSLTGIIATGISDNQMADMMKFSEDKTEFSIDMSRVSRVDFMSVGNFLTTLMQLSQAGKKVAIIGANEMIQGLFSAMGVNQFANVVRKTK